MQPGNKEFFQKRFDDLRISQEIVEAVINFDNINLAQAILALFQEQYKALQCLQLMNDGDDSCPSFAQAEKRAHKSLEEHVKKTFLAPLLVLKNPS